MTKVRGSLKIQVLKLPELKNIIAFKATYSLLSIFNRRIGCTISFIIRRTTLLKVNGHTQI